MVYKKNRGPKVSIRTYVVCCYKCEKWREISKYEFEAIRESLEEEAWFCGRDPGDGRSCEHPEDFPYDNNQIWVMDRAGIPRPPPGTERLVIMRRDLSKADIYYQMPNGKRVRGHGDVERFLEENPTYRATMPASSFSFATPKIVRETVEGSSQSRAARADQRGKRSEGSSLGRAAKAGQRERSQGSSLGRAERAESESSEETDASDSDYDCPSSSGGSE